MMASKKLEDKGGWEKLKGKKANSYIRLPLPASLTIEHVVYSTIVKSQDNPSPSVHCYYHSALSDMNIPFIRHSSDSTTGYT